MGFTITGGVGIGSPTSGETREQFQDAGIRMHYGRIVNNALVGNNCNKDIEYDQAGTSVAAGSLGWSSLPGDGP
jgi:hypothetical protein